MGLYTAHLSRVKGQNGELEVRHLIEGFVGVKVDGNPDQPREGRSEINLKPYGIKVKRRKSFNTLHKWFRQAEEACGDSATPVVAVCADHGCWLAVVHLETFLKLAREGILWEQAKPKDCD